MFLFEGSCPAEIHQSLQRNCPCSCSMLSLRTSCSLPPSLLLLCRRLRLSTTGQALFSKLSRNGHQVLFKIGIQIAIRPFWSLNLANSCLTCVPNIIKWKSKLKIWSNYHNLTIIINILINVLNLKVYILWLKEIHSKILNFEDYIHIFLFF